MTENNVDSIKELVEYLKYNCYRNDSINVGSFGTKGYDGFSVEFTGQEYEFNYQERGHKQVLKKFFSEKEVCNYAVTIIEKSETLRQHCIEFTKSEEKAKKICHRLEKRGIRYQKDKIPYEENNFRYRIFVFGRDIKETRFLKLF
jgi:hypothetical protein